MTPSTPPTLLVAETFISLHGEANRQGFPAQFIRLCGCSLQCLYCDTAWAQDTSHGKGMTIPELVHECQASQCQDVLITGGEPLEQNNVHLLMQELCKLNFNVYLETSGSISIKAVDPRVHIIMDLKLPSSQVHHKMHWDNMQLLKPKDQLKLVIGTEQDFTWGKQHIEKYNPQVSEIICTPSYNQLDPHILAQWILHERLHWRVQIQLHKYLHLQ